MVKARKKSGLLVVLVAVLVIGGSTVGVLLPMLRGSLGASVANSSSTATIPGTTYFGLGTPVYAVSGSVSGETSPSTTYFGTTIETSTATMTVSTTTSLPQTQGSSNSAAPTQATAGRDIEFFSNLTLDVNQPSTALQQTSEIASSFGGYVADSTYSESFATVTVRVPSQDYQAALSQLEGLGTVVSASSSSDDVTVQYTDLNATLQSLLTEQTSLLKLLGQSNSVNATLNIESVLQKTDAEINSVESTILDTAQLINYASIGIDFMTVVPHTSVPLAIKLSATPLRGTSPLSVTFNALVSGGVQPYIVNFNFGDGTSAQGQQLIHQFTQPGKYNVTVSATDQSGNVSLAWVMVYVSSPPVSSGLTAFGGYVWSLFAGVVEGIVEVAVIVLPIFAVLYVGVLPAYRRMSRNEEPEEQEEGPAKTP